MPERSQSLLRRLQALAAQVRDKWPARRLALWSRHSAVAFFALSGVLLMLYGILTTIEENEVRAQGEPYCGICSGWLWMMAAAIFCAPAGAICLVVGRAAASVAAQSAGNSDGSPLFP